jgi:chromosome segregation ATPase
MNFIKQIFRTIFLVDLFQSWKLKKAGDKIFSGSVEGRRAYYHLKGEEKKKRYQDFLDNLSRAEVALEQKRGQLKNIQKQRAEAQKALDGVVSAFTKAETAGNTEKVAQIKADGKEYQAKVRRLTDEETALKAQIETTQEGFKPMERQLAALRQEIQNMPQEEAEAIANFISNSALIETQERLAGMLSSEGSELDSVGQAIKEYDDQLAAKAQVVNKLAGQDKTAMHEEYLREAEGQSADDDFDALVAAKKAEKASATGVTTEKPAVVTDSSRPEI